MGRAKMIAKTLLIVALVATLVTLLFIRSAAYLAAISVPVFFTIYVVVSLLEKQSRTEEVRKPGQTTISDDEVNLDVRDAGIYTGLGIALLLALGAFIIAASLFEWPLVGAIATTGFLLAVLINIPYLSLLVQEAKRDEHERITRQNASKTDSDADDQEQDA